MTDNERDCKHISGAGHRGWRGLSFKIGKLCRFMLQGTKEYAKMREYFSENFQICLFFYFFYFVMHALRNCHSFNHHIRIRISQYLVHGSINWRSGVDQKKNSYFLANYSCFCFERTLSVRCAYILHKLSLTKHAPIWNVSFESNWGCSLEKIVYASYLFNRHASSKPALHLLHGRKVLKPGPSEQGLGSFSVKVFLFFNWQKMSKRRMSVI